MTWAWLLGVRRARILAIAICISTGDISATTRASLAGVVPPISRTTSARGTLTSTAIRASVDVIERHRLVGDREVDAVAGDELVDHVELDGVFAVEFDHHPVTNDQRR